MNITDYTAETSLKYGSNPNPELFKVLKYGHIVFIDLITESMSVGATDTFLMMELPEECKPISTFNSRITLDDINVNTNIKINCNSATSIVNLQNSTSFSNQKICIHVSYLVA